MTNLNKGNSVKLLYLDKSKPFYFNIRINKQKSLRWQSATSEVYGGKKRLAIYTKRKMFIFVPFSIITGEETKK